MIIREYYNDLETDEEDGWILLARWGTVIFLLFLVIGATAAVMGNEIVAVFFIGTLSLSAIILLLLLIAFILWEELIKLTKRFFDERNGDL